MIENSYSNSTRMFKHNNVLKLVMYKHYYQNNFDQLFLGPTKLQFDTEDDKGRTILYPGGGAWKFFEIKINKIIHLMSKKTNT